MAKQVLTDDPNNVKVLIALGYGGVIASTEARNETFNADATNYAAESDSTDRIRQAPDYVGLPSRIKKTCWLHCITRSVSTR